MRVVAGSYGGRPLKTLSGDNTRPTSDKVKGSIFNMIGPYFDGGIVCDLFSGSGSLGIEAISRGADFAYLVDKNYKAIQIIQQNVAMTKEELKFQIIKSDANKALISFALKKITFDLIFLDPPYALEEIQKQIEEMCALELVSQTCVIVCETAKEVVFPQELASFVLRKTKVYGISRISVFDRKK